MFRGCSAYSLKLSAEGVALWEEEWRSWLGQEREEVWVRKEVSPEEEVEEAISGRGE